MFLVMGWAKNVNSAAGGNHCGFFVRGDGKYGSKG